MKILQIINNLTSGGAEKLLKDLCLELKYDRYKCDILLLFDIDNVYVNELKKNNISVTVLGRCRYSILYFFKIRSFIKKGKYDVIHTHLFPTQYYVPLSLIGLHKRFKLVTTEHSTYNKRRKVWFLRKFEKRIYTMYDSIICVSDESAIQLSKHIQNKDKIVVIPNGVPLKKIYNARPSNDPLFDKGKIYLIVIGRFVQEKQQETVIKALPELDKNIHLVLVGEGKLKDKNIALSKTLEVSDRIHFLGYRPDVPSLLKSSDIVVIPSAWEGFGLVAVEGMAAGKPVIASSVKGLKEIVENTGLLFQPGNSKDLAMKINKLISDTELYNEIVMKSKDVVKKYDVKQMVRKYLRVYEN